MIMKVGISPQLVDRRIIGEPSWVRPCITGILCLI